MVCAQNVASRQAVVAKHDDVWAFHLRSTAVVIGLLEHEMGRGCTIGVGTVGMGAIVNTLGCMVVCRIPVGVLVKYEGR